MTPELVCARHSQLVDTLLLLWTNLNRLAIFTLANRTKPGKVLFVFFVRRAPVHIFDSQESEKRPLRRRAKRRRKRASLEVRRLPSVGVALRISSVFPSAATANPERAMSHGRCALPHLLGTHHQSGESATGSAKLGRLRQCEEGLKAIEAAVDVESVVAAMRGREESAEVQKAACLHIGRLAEGNGTRAGTAGAVEAVAAAVRAHTGSAGVQVAACLLCLA